MLAPTAFTAVFVVVAAVHTTHPAPDLQIFKSDNLVLSLRKKLIKDNYDYVTASEDVVNFRANDKLERQENISEVISKTSRKEKPSKHNAKTNYYVSKLNVATHVNDNDDIDDRKKEIQVNERAHITVSHKDLLYYMDDESLTEKKSINEDDLTKKNENTASVKYRVLKTKHKNYRRKGQTHFIQEESKDGFAIVKLGDGPFPALRLPPARRQYMRDSVEAGSEEEEVPPPPVSSEATEHKIPQ